MYTVLEGVVGIGWVGGCVWGARPLPYHSLQQGPGQEQMPTNPAGGAGRQEWGMYHQNGKYAAAGCMD